MWRKGAADVHWMIRCINTPCSFLQLQICIFWRYQNPRKGVLAFREVLLILISMRTYPFAKTMLFTGIGFFFLTGVSSCKKKTTSAFTSETLTLQLDAYTSSSSKAFQGGFVAGEGGAVVLSGPAGFKFKLNKVLFLFGGSGAQTATGTLRIYKENGNVAPGEILHESDFSVTTSEDSLRVLDISGANLRFAAASSFRVLIMMKSNGYPSIAADNDGTIADLKNWIYSGSSWMSSASLGLKGDWIIRAQVSTEE
jgi:hypothetical protein